MGCKKGVARKKPKKGRFKCTECGAVVKKKADVCDPSKIKKKARSPLRAGIEKAPMPPRRAR